MFLYFFILVTNYWTNNMNWAHSDEGAGATKKGQSRSGLALWVRQVGRSMRARISLGHHDSLPGGQMFGGAV